MPTLTLIITILAPVATFFDCLTTHQGIKAHGIDWEQNDLAKRGMQKFGIWFVWYFWFAEIIILAISYWQLRLINNLWCDILYIAFLLFYIALRLTVALVNHTGKKTFLFPAVLYFVNLANGIKSMLFDKKSE